MYVLIIARGYPSETYKMNGIFEFDQARALKEAGMKVVLAAVDTRSLRRRRKMGWEKQVLQGIPTYVLNVPLGRIPKKLRGRIKAFGLKKLFSRILKAEGRPDLIHAHFISNGFTAAEALKTAGIPLVLTEHFRGMNQQPISPYYRALGAATYPRMDRVLAVSEALAENIRAEFQVDVQVVPNVVDLTTFSPNSAKAQRAWDPAGFRFVSAGGLTAVKRMDLLIEAFHRAFSSEPSVTLAIFGAGPMQKQLEDQIHELDLQDRVALRGLVSRSELAQSYRESDAFVLASRTETFGLAYIEAMAAGLPVIATRSGGPDEFVTRERGILVPVDETGELAEAMRAMRGRSSQYDRAWIADSVQADYSGRAVSGTLQAIYREVLAEHTASRR